MRGGNHTVTINDESISALNNLVFRLPFDKTRFNINVKEYKDITENMMRDYVKRKIYVHTYAQNCNGVTIEDAHLAKIVFLRHCLFPINHVRMNKPFMVCPTTESFIISGFSSRSETNYNTICKMYELCNSTVPENKEASEKIIEEQTKEKEHNIKKIENKQSSLAIICAIPGTGKSTTGSKYKKQGYFTYDRDEEAEHIKYPYDDGELTLKERLQKPYNSISETIGTLDLNVLFKRYLTFTLRVLCRNIYKTLYTHIVRSVQKNLIEVARTRGQDCMCESVGFTSDLDLVIPFINNYQIDILVMDKDKIYNQQGQRMLTQNRGSLYFTICAFEATLKDFIRECKVHHAAHTTILRALDSRTETETIIWKGKPQIYQSADVVKNTIIRVWNEKFIPDQPTYIILLIIAIIGFFYIIYATRDKIFFNVFSNDSKFMSGRATATYYR
jgi:hypothetical protein